MSRWAYYLDFALMPALASTLLWLHLGLYGPSLRFLALLFLGIAVWTLVEYLLHRVAHWMPGLKHEHEKHHEHPAAFSGPPSTHTTAVALILILLAVWAFGLFTATGLMGGLLAAYAAFLWLHYAIHHWPIGPSSGLYRLKKRHLAHHHGEHGNFGVLGDWWDRVFKTEFK